MVTHMTQKVNKTLSPDRKMWMYSVHDMTISTLLLSLGVYNSEIPPYASAVLIELRKTADLDHVVTVSCITNREWKIS